MTAEGFVRAHMFDTRPRRKSLQMLALSRSRSSASIGFGANYLQFTLSFLDLWSHRCGEVGSAVSMMDVFIRVTLNLSSARSDFLPRVALTFLQFPIIGWCISAISLVFSAAFYLFLIANMSQCVHLSLGMII